MRLMLVFSVLLSTLLPTAAWAFGSTGHQQICQLAYQQATATTKQHIDALLQLKPGETFAKGCVWPDEARNEPAFSYSKPHHFMNVKRDASKVEHQDCASVGCLLSAIRHHSAVLKTTQPSMEKLQSLLFLSHFVGDLHQPLHVSYADDLGGNKTAVYYFGKPSNLHGIWDTAMLKSLGYANNQQLAATKLATLRPVTVRQWQSGQPLNWAQQSLAQTRRVYQSYKPGMLFSQPELDRDGPLIETRLLQAAVRLAWQLDQLLQPATGN